jgi:hypothetical protein
VVEKILLTLPYLPKDFLEAYLPVSEVLFPRGLVVLLRLRSMPYVWRLLIDFVKDYLPVVNDHSNIFQCIDR